MESISTPWIVALFVLWFFFLYKSYQGQPKGLWALAVANTGERFGYYTMLAVFVMFLQANFGFSAGIAGTIYSSFLMLVYFLPLFGGMLADKFGYSKMVTIGIFIMFAGYVLLALPLGANSLAIVTMGASLLLVSLGTGLFKGNLQVMVGDLYNQSEFADKRDAGFSLFYMAINVGALFAPTAAVEIMDWAQSTGVSVADSYHYAFGVACASLIFSIAVYYLAKPTFKHVITATKSVKKNAEAVVDDMSPAETKERIICLVLVYAVVVFFWMAFHQNGLTLTYFARDYTATTSTGFESMLFDVRNLLAAIFIVYGIFGIIQQKGLVRIVAVLMLVGGLGFLFNMIPSADDVTKVDAPIFQQFNACFVVMLTPVSIAIFSALSNVKAPVKIGLGMLVAASAYLLMTVSSFGYGTPEVSGDGPKAMWTDPVHMADASPSLLINTYLILTFAELLLSPIGISFVTKVAPTKYKGMMMGGWFVSTAIGNFLTVIPAWLWGGCDLWIVWAVLLVICLLAAAFIFSIIKKLNKVA